MDNKENPISIERFAAYLDGNLDAQDMRDVFMQIQDDDGLRPPAEQCVAVAMDVHCLLSQPHAADTQAG